MFTSLKSSLLVIALFIAGTSAAHAGSAPKAPTAGATEARNETAAPGYSSQVREARRVSTYLADALQLNNTQLRIIQGLILAEQQSLALAVTPTDISQARQHFLLKVRRTLTFNQMASYTAFCQDARHEIQPLGSPQLLTVR